MRAVQDAGRAALPGAVVLPDYRLLRPAAGESRHAGLVRHDPHRAAELARAERGRRNPLRGGGRPDGRSVGSLNRPTAQPPNRRHFRLHHPAGHPLRRHVHGAGTGASAGDPPDDAGPGRRSRRVYRSGGIERSGRPQGRRPGQDRCSARRDGHQPGHRARDPHLDRRLCADGIRHRGHHGGAGAR